MTQDRSHIAPILKVKKKIHFFAPVSKRLGVGGEKKGGSGGLGA